MSHCASFPQKRARAAVQPRADRWSEDQRCRKPAFTCDPAPHSLRQHRLECVVAAPRDEAQSGRREGARLSRVLSGAASRAGGPGRLAPVVGRGRARSPGRRERNSLIFGRCEIDREGRHEDRVQGEQGQPMEEPDHRVETCSSGSPSVRSISIPHCHALAGWPGGEIESGAFIPAAPHARAEFCSDRVAWLREGADRYAGLLILTLAPVIRARANLVPAKPQRRQSRRRFGNMRETTERGRDAGGT